MNAKILLISALVIGFVGLGLGIMACTRAERATGSDQTCPEPFSMVVQMAGKELTIDAPRLSPGYDGEGVLTVMVKNSGQTPITLAEIEVIFWAQYYEDGKLLWEEEGGKGWAQVKDLSPGEVRTVIWLSLTGEPRGFTVNEGSLRVRVTRIE